MNDEEARFILTAYRPGGADANAPEFADALALAGNDPELRQWFAREQAMDRLVGEKLQLVQPPSGLRDRILAGGRFSRRQPWFRSAKVLAWAALLVLSTVLTLLFWKPIGRPDLANFAMNYADRGFELEDKADDLTQLTRWLQEKNMPIPGRVPSHLASLEKIGCRTLRYEGKKVSVICFSGDKTYHLFVMEKSAVPFSTKSSEHRIAQSGKWSSASWSDAKHEYVLVSQAGPAAIERLL